MAASERNKHKEKERREKEERNMVEKGAERNTRRGRAERVQEHVRAKSTHNRMIERREEKRRRKTIEPHEGMELIIGKNCIRAYKIHATTGSDEKKKLQCEEGKRSRQPDDSRQASGKPNSVRSTVLFFATEYGSQQDHCS